MEMKTRNKYLRFAVCDINRQANELASRFISEYYKNKNEQPEIEVFNDTEGVIGAFRRQNGFAAVFIGMNSMDEVDTAWVIRKLAPNCPLVIMSDSGDYSLEGYRLDAFDYWLKPLDEKKMNRTLERLWHSPRTGGANKGGL